jgi:hypothetical protein
MRMAIGCVMAFTPSSGASAERHTDFKLFEIRRPRSLRKPWRRILTFLRCRQFPAGSPVQARQGYSGNSSPTATGGAVLAGRAAFAGYTVGEDQSGGMPTNEPAGALQSRRPQPQHALAHTAFVNFHQLRTFRRKNLCEMCQDRTSTAVQQFRLEVSVIRVRRSCWQKTSSRNEAPGPPSSKR